MKIYNAETCHSEPAHDMLNILTEDFIEEGQYCQQTVIDLVAYAKYLERELIRKSDGLDACFKLGGQLAENIAAQRKEAQS